MTVGTLTQRLRPLRFAFLVDPSNRPHVLQAIELASMQWGGMFNPIIPVFRGRLPQIWSREKYFRKGKPTAIANGYLAGFDPDIIVPVGGDFNRSFDPGNRQVIKPADLMGEYGKNGMPNYGIGAFELVRYLAEKEFTFVRRAPLHILLPKFSKAHALFLSSVFGAWPTEISDLVRRQFGEPLGLSEPVCSVSNFETLLAADNLFPRRIGLAKIKYYPRDATVFCLDATSALDVIDFWNLRAAGFYVIAAPTQAFACEGLRAFVKGFVQEQYRAHRYNPDYFFDTTFQVGRSLTEPMVSEFIKSLDIPVDEKKHQPKYSVRWWYPRLWDRWALEETDERPEPFFAGERDAPIKDSDASLDLRTLDPPFVQKWVWSDGARVANELEYRIYDSVEPIAEVIPEGSQELARRILQGALNDVRFSRSGPVYLAKQHDRRVYFKIPSAQKFMLAWLQTQGWKAQLSSPGLIATQMLKRLKGKFGVHIIDYEGVIKLIDRHASERTDPNNRDAPIAPKWLAENALLGELDRILREEESFVERDRYLQLLLEHDVLRLGLQLHCPTCARWMWKPIDQLDEQIECEHCLTKFSIAAAPRNEREWSYKPIGPFNVRHFSGGAYTVLLTWKFFEGRHHRPTTPLFSFTAKKNNQEIEVDLALFCRDQKYHGQKNVLLLVECKAYHEFEKVDVERMATLGSHFPGALLVFSKMGRNLSQSEVRLLIRLVNEQRKLWKAGKPHCTVMVITGTELFSEWQAPECWKDKGGNFEVAYKKWRNLRSLSDLAEATQELYLGIPRLHEWIDAQRAKRRRVAVEHNRGSSEAVEAKVGS